MSANNIDWKDKLILAPMAGITDLPFRLLCKEQGCDILYTEMVSAKAILYKNRNTEPLMHYEEREHPIGLQLFGSDPDIMADIAARVQDKGYDFIDINMGCPVPKIVNNGEGSALMKDPELVGRIVSSMVKAVNVPVTVKIRRGRRIGEEVAPEFARAMEDSGASAIAVHGRFANQLYHGESDWGCVRRVAQAVSVPVIGSGDVSSAQAATRMLLETGASAVMIARGSYGNPWIFGDARDVLAGRPPAAHDSREKIAAFRCHVRLLEATGANLKRARSLAGWYLRGMPEAARLRGMAVTCQTLDDYLAVADVAERMLEDAG